MKLYRNTWIFITALLILVSLVLIPTTLFTRMLRKDIDQFQDTITEINHRLAEGQDPTDACNDLEHLWHAHRRHWSFYVHHNIVDNLDMLFAAYLTESRNQNTKAALSEAARIVSLLNAAEENDRLTWHNVF